MNPTQKEVLRKVFEHKDGLLSQSDLLNLLPDRNTKISHSLITSGYIEEVTRKIKATQIEATFYRVTEKGQDVFEPIHKRIWYFLKGDIRTIVVATITALITTLLAKYLP